MCWYLCVGNNLSNSLLPSQCLFKVCKQGPIHAQPCKSSLYCCSVCWRKTTGVRIWKLSRATWKERITQISNDFPCFRIYPFISLGEIQSCLPKQKTVSTLFFKKDAFPEFTVFAVAWVWNEQTYTNTNFQYCLMVFWVVNITYIAISICCLILIDNWLWSKTQKWYLKIL